MAIVPLSEWRMPTLIWPSKSPLAVSPPPPHAVIVTPTAPAARPAMSRFESELIISQEIERGSDDCPLGTPPITSESRPVQSVTTGTF